MRLQAERGVLHAGAGRDGVVAAVTGIVQRLLADQETVGQNRQEADEGHGGEGEEHVDGTAHQMGETVLDPDHHQQCDEPKGDGQPDEGRGSSGLLVVSGSGILGE